ncbi:IS21 family transposase, partial [Candidatus Aerophobetes bacterium]
MRQLNRQGYGKRTIARMLGVSRNTVKRALKEEDI